MREVLPGRREEGGAANSDWEERTGVGCQLFLVLILDEPRQSVAGADARSVAVIGVIRVWVVRGDRVANSVVETLLSASDLNGSGLWAYRSCHAEFPCLASLYSLT